MFREVKRKASTWNDQEQIENLLHTAPYGFLSVGITDNGYVYGVPISFVYDQEANKIYFHGAAEGQKLELLEQGKKVTFCVVGSTKVIPEKFTTAYESVMVFGTIDLHLSDDEKRKVMNLVIQKFSSEYKTMGEKMVERSLDKISAYSIDIQHITGKAIHQ